MCGPYADTGIALAAFCTAAIPMAAIVTPLVTSTALYMNACVCKSRTNDSGVAVRAPTHRTIEKPNNRWAHANQQTSLDE